MPAKSKYWGRILFFTRGRTALVREKREVKKDTSLMPLS